MILGININIFSKKVLQNLIYCVIMFCVVIKYFTKGYSSVGRTPVSKTGCRGFKSFCPCQNKRSPIGDLLFWQDLQKKDLM